MKSHYLCACTSVFIAIIISLSGCATSTYGKRIEQDKISQIKKGVSTRADVIAALGPPTNVAMIGDGRRLLMYSYFDLSAQQDAVSYIPLFGMFAGKTTGQTRNQTLQIMLNKNDVVEDYEFSDQTRDIETGAFGYKSTPSTQGTPQSK